MSAVEKLESADLEQAGEFTEDDRLLALHPANGMPAQADKVVDERRTISADGIHASAVPIITCDACCYLLQTVLLGLLLAALGYDVWLRREVLLKPTFATRYLVFIPAAGFGNQVQSLDTAITVANLYNRTLVIPPILSSHAMSHQVMWYDVTARSVEKQFLRFNLSRTLQLESDYRFFILKPGFVKQGTVLLSDLILTHGATLDCWNWGGDWGGMARMDSTPFFDTDCPVTCIGFPFALQTPIPNIPANLWFAFNYTIIQAAQQWIARSGLKANSYNCVHYRAGDFQGMVGSLFVNLTGVFRYIDQKIPHFNDNNTLILTNSELASELDAITNRGWVLVDESAYSRVGDDSPLRAMRRIYVEQYICQTSNVFIGCGGSSFTRYIALFRNCSYDNIRCYDYCT